MKLYQIALTGWAHHSDLCDRWKVDHAIRWSDHADFNDLMEAIQIVKPKHLFCTHGPNVEGFVSRLNSEGYQASVLEDQKKIYRPAEHLHSM